MEHPEETTDLQQVTDEAFLSVIDVNQEFLPVTDYCHTNVKILLSIGWY